MFRKVSLTMYSSGQCFGFYWPRIAVAQGPIINRLQDRSGLGKSFGIRIMLTVKEAAQRIGVSPALVYGWVESRQLAHFRLGGKGKRGGIRIDEADLEAFIKSRRIEPEGAAAPSVKPQVRKPKLKFITF